MSDHVSDQYVRLAERCPAKSDSTIDLFLSWTYLTVQFVLGKHIRTTSSIEPPTLTGVCTIGAFDMSLVEKVGNTLNRTFMEKGANKTIDLSLFIIIAFCHVIILLHPDSYDFKQF